MPKTQLDWPFLSALFHEMKKDYYLAGPFSKLPEKQQEFVEDELWLTIANVLSRNLEELLSEELQA